MTEPHHCLGCAASLDLRPCFRTQKRPSGPKYLSIVKPQLEEKEGKTFDVFTAVEFKAQLVAGKNYFIKVKDTGQWNPSCYYLVQVFFIAFFTFQITKS
uniref:Cystatin domain-containing protein n=1 Tax=Cairina moschata TaxID=8855 RepID=A0A8C3GN26_CAIMO